MAGARDGRSLEQLNEISDRIIEIQTEVMKVHRKNQQGRIDSEKYEQQIEKLKQELQKNETSPQRTVIAAVSWGLFCVKGLKF